MDKETLLKLIKIPNITIQKTNLRTDGSFYIYVETNNDIIHCRKCGRETEKCNGRARELHLRHLPMFDQPVYIVIQPKRGKCSYCEDNPTTNQRVDWYEPKKGRTKLYEDYILHCMINSTVQDVSLKESIGYEEVSGIIEHRIQTEVDWKQIDKIGALGIDEIAVKKGYKDYLTIITSHTEERNCILQVLKGKDKAKVKAFFKTIPQRLRKTIIAVCSDLYLGYVNAAKEVFGKSIPIVVDRFHVANLYRDCLVSLRKTELKRLRETIPEDKYRALKEPISILVKNKECVSEQETKKLKPLFKLSPKLKRAFSYCRKLTCIFNSHVPKRSASKKMNQWMSEVKASGLRCFDNFLNTINTYKNEVLNYFKDRQNSGFVEGLNNKIKVIKRRCYGIFNPNTLFQRLFLDLSGYQLFGSLRVKCHHINS